MNEDPALLGNNADRPTKVGDKDSPAGLTKKDPTDTDHPTGEQQAAENAANESPS